ncbi:unnamed protein product [marine sediment metagenome]|uniref:Uncharacterized protein n=1 Tax=marine sediment metagenome TaxID=412755 RepID=X1UF94_9ZZZZ
MNVPYTYPGVVLGTSSDSDEISCRTPDIYLSIKKEEIIPGVCDDPNSK